MFRDGQRGRGQLGPGQAQRAVGLLRDPGDQHLPAKHHQVAAYFEAYVDHFNFRDTITFNTRVTAVERAGGARAALTDEVGRAHRRVTTQGPEGTMTREYAVRLAPLMVRASRAQQQAVARRLRHSGTAP